MSGEFTGGPETAAERVRRWLRPRGGALSDGARLAAINSLGLTAAVVWVAAISLGARLVDRLVPVPVLLAGFVAVLVAVAIGMWGWYRYGRAHAQAARATGSDPRGDVFGAIGATPFAVVAVALLSFGVLSLFFAAITFSGSRLVDALRQLGLATLFAGVAATCLVMARASSGGMTGDT